MQRPKAETVDALRAQLGLLAKSCRDFDEGDRDEVVRIAQALRVILNSSGRDSVSLAAQVGATQGRFVDTSADYSETNTATYSGLIWVQIDFGAQPPTMRPHPALDSVPGGKRRLVRFLDWWNLSPVIRDNTRSKFTRRQLVCWMANEDGGSHVDPGLTVAYHRLSRGNALGWSLQLAGMEEVPMSGAVDASIRQIGHETLRTFQRRHPELFHAVRYEMYKEQPPRTEMTDTGGGLLTPTPGN